MSHVPGFDYEHEKIREGRRNMALVLSFIVPSLMFGIAFAGITIGINSNSIAIFADSVSKMVGVALTLVVMVAAYLRKEALAVGDKHGVQKKIKFAMNAQISVLFIAAIAIIAMTWTREQPSAPVHQLEMVIGSAILWTFYYGLERLSEKGGANQWAYEAEIPFCGGFGRWSSGIVAVGGLLMLVTGLTDLDAILTYAVAACMALEMLVILGEDLMKK